MKLEPAVPAEASDVSLAAITAIIPALRAYAMRRLRSGGHVDDAVQDTIERAWRARGTFRQGEDIKPWIFRILRNAIIDAYRKDAPMVQDVDGAAAMRLVTEPDQLWRLHYAEAISAFEVLPSNQRQALFLMMTGATHVEAATLMNCPLGTFKGYLRLGRLKLRSAGV